MVEVNYGGGTILSSPLFVEVILPFILIFALVFAILQKSEVLGKGKKQIDAIVALVIGLIVISFGYAIKVILGLIPFLAVSIVIILVFMILFGAFYKEGTFDLHDKVKLWGGIIVFAGVASAVVYFTGLWEYIHDYIQSGRSPGLITNIVFVVFIIIAMAIVLGFGKKAEGGK